MHTAHLDGFDLNLLRYLDALLSEQSVSGAARRVGLSQPAMSRALSRLRAQFGDDLLVRGRRGMELTTRGTELVQPVRDILERVGATLSGGEAFEPEISSRRFRLAMTDYVQTFLLGPLLARLRESAPGIDVAFSRAAWIEQADDTTDLVLVPRSPAGAGVRWQRVLDDRYVCIVRRRHPGVGKRLTKKQYAALPHLLVAPGGRPGSFMDRLLADEGYRRSVAVQVPDFLGVPAIVAGSDLIATIPARLAVSAESQWPITVHPLPFAVPPLSLSLGWFERHHRDPGHRWFRQLVAAECRAL